MRNGGCPSPESITGIAVAVVVASVAVLVALVVWAEWFERRRRRRWHRDYFHRGGLIRQLMRNWRSRPRLTDQRERDAED